MPPRTFFCESKEKVITLPSAMAMKSVGLHEERMFATSTDRGKAAPGSPKLCSCTIARVDKSSTATDADWKKEMMHTVVGDGGIVMLAISDAAENIFEETGFNWLAISSTCKVIPPTTSRRCSELAHAAVILT
jgi:hypothetical protein